MIISIHPLGSVGKVPKMSHFEAIFHGLTYDCAKLTLGLQLNSIICLLMRTLRENLLGNILTFVIFITLVILLSDLGITPKYIIYGFALGVGVTAIFLLAKLLHWSVICDAIFLVSLVFVGLTFIFTRLIPDYWSFLLGLFLSISLSVAIVSWHRKEWITWRDLYGCRRK